MTEYKLAKLADREFIIQVKFHLKLLTEATYTLCHYLFICWGHFFKECSSSHSSFSTRFPSTGRKITSSFGGGITQKCFLSVFGLFKGVWKKKVFGIRNYAWKTSNLNFQGQKMAEITRARKFLPYKSDAAGYIEYFPSNSRGPFLENSRNFSGLFRVL